MGAYEKPSVRAVGRLEELTLGDTFGEWGDYVAFNPYGDADPVVVVS